MKKQPMNSAPNLSCKLVTWLTTLCFALQTAIPAYALTMTDSQIETDLASNQAFYRDTTNADFQYIASPYLNASAPAGATNAEELLSDVIDQYDHAVGGPTYVPIGVGGINIIIPTYKQFKSAGDPLVEARYVRAQMRSLLGRTLIDSDQTAYASEAAQLNTLYQNALSYIQSNPNLTLGDNLGLNQDGANGQLPYPMIWPELRTVHGEEVLVPILYLTSAEMDRVVDRNVTEFNSGASFYDLVIEGTTIQLGRDAFLDIVNSLINNGGELLGSGDLQIRVGGELVNLSGLIQAQGDLSIAAKSINSGTIVHQYATYGGQAGLFGEIASIDSATGSVVLRAYEDILIAGTIVSAGQDIRFAADGSVYIGTVEITSNYAADYSSITSQRSSIEYLGSVLSAEQSIEIIANGEIVIDASEIVADNGHIELLAGLGITVVDALNTSQSYFQGEWHNGSREESAYKTVAMRSLLDAGKDLIIHSEFGNITLQAVDISSTAGTSVTATNGGIELLVTKETDHYSYSAVKESLFTAKTINRGHDSEVVVPNSIVGGFQTDALYGLKVEYEGDANYTFDQQVNALAAMPGLEWMADARNSADVDWVAVESKYEEWNESSTALSPAAVALITIVVTVATGGAGAGWGEAIATSAGATSTTTIAAASAASSAATLSLVTASTIAATNAVLNGEDPLEAVFETVTDSDALKSAAIAAVTAGAISALDAEFFNATEIGGENPTSGLVSNVTDTAGNVTGEFALSLGGQAVQAATHAAVVAGTQIVVNGGDLGDFGDVLLQSFAQSSIDILGERLATQIGIASKPDAAGNPPDINQITRYIAHAATGCLTGALTSELGGGNTTQSCASGAGGAVVGEFIGDLYIEAHADELAAAEAFLEENADYAEFLASDLALVDTDVLEMLDGQSNHHIGQLMQINAQGVDLARLGAGLTAFLAGAEADQIDIAANAGANAAENNALWFIPMAIVALKAIDLAITVKEYSDLYADYEAAITDQDKRDVLEAFFGDKVEEAAMEIIIEQALQRIIPGATTVTTMAEIAAERGLISPRALEKIKSLIRKNDPEPSRYHTDIPESSVDNLLARKANGETLPHPINYMDQADIDAHLDLFDDGAVRFSLQADVDDYGTLGGIDAFAMPKAEFDALVAETGGDLEAIARRLDLDETKLISGDLKPFFVPPEHISNIRMPTGNEVGAIANELWVPGGYTKSGVPEAVMDLTGAQFTEIILQ